MHFNHRPTIEEIKFAYSTFVKPFTKQTENQIDAIKSIDPSNKLNQNLMND